MALAQNTPVAKELGENNELPVAAASRIYEGAMVGLNTSGYARGLVAGDLFCGHACAEANNSAGSNGTIRVQVLRGRYQLEVTLASVAVTDVGKPVYASDDGTLSLTAGKTKVGRVQRYVTTNTCVVEFNPFNVGESIVREFDCETAAGDSSAKMLYPAWANPSGLLVESVYGVITEVFAGASEDQGVVTVRDTVPNTITTITVADSSGDAAGDVRLGYDISRATVGDAGKTVAAGVGIEAIVSQGTSGASAAGKMKVYLRVTPLN